MSDGNDKYWQLLNALSQAGDRSELRHSIMQALDHIGFEAAYFLAPVTADPRYGRRLTAIGMPESWEKRYQEEFLLVDPLPTLAIAQNWAFRWSEVPPLTSLSRKAAAYVELMARFSRLDGVGMGCFGPQSQRGFMGVARPRSAEALSDFNLLKVQAIAQISFRRHCELVPISKLEVPALSSRELDVIQWIARGKSNAVIAEILGITKSSVDIYVKRIFSKLEVSNRTTASVRAISLGLISP